MSLYFKRRRLRIYIFYQITKVDDEGGGGGGAKNLGGTN